MGELLDSLNSLDVDAATPFIDQQTAMDQVVELFNAVTGRIGGTIDAGMKPGMPLDILTKTVRKAPLLSLAIGFLVGIAVARRR